MGFVSGQIEKAVSCGWHDHSQACQHRLRRIRSAPPMGGSWSLRALDLIYSFVTESPLKSWSVFLVLGLVIEAIVTPARKYETSSVWLNIRYSVVYALMIFFLAPGVSVAMNHVLQRTGAGFIDLDLFHADSILEQIGAAVVFVVIYDFFYYWLHRAQHSFGWLWEQHAIHHSDDALNVSTTVRHHWLEPLFQAIAVTLPMSIIFKLTPVSMWTVSTFIAAYTGFNHLNLRLGFGRLSWLASSPQLHRIHHSIKPRHFDKNFAAYFPVWDVLFGTYYHPAPDEYPATGVDGLQIISVSDLSLRPFRKWAGSLCRAVMTLTRTTR